MMSSSSSSSSSSDYAIDSVLEQMNTCSNMPAELMEVFRDEADEHLRTIYHGLDLLRNNQDDREALADVRRASHTLKGAAGAVNMQTATRLSHRMEDLLDWLASRNESANDQQIELLLKSADQLQQLTSGKIDIPVVATQIAEIYQEFARELGDVNSEASCQPATIEFPGCDAKTDQFTSAPSNDRNKIVRNSVQYLRVPVSRLDELMSLHGEMIVNRSEFQHRLSEFESRIEDLQSALERMRAATRHVGEHQLVQNSYTGDQNVYGSNRQNFGSVVANSDLPATATGFDPLEFEQYSEFDLLTQSLAEADSDAEIMDGELRKVKSSFELLLRRQRQLNREARQCLARIRMVPLNGIVVKLERTVRTVSAKVGRPAELKIVGGQTEIDKLVLDSIADPLLHLIRNSIDHGIESKEVRRAAGKPETAQIMIEAINHGTRVTLRVSDDGAGIDVDRVRAKAVKSGLIEAGQNLSTQEIQSLIFHPGFSTASELTDVSGRGLGMDIVKDSIRQLKGTIFIDSEQGAGTTFTINIPANTGVTRVVMIETGGKQFAIPVDSVEQILRLDPESVESTTEQSATTQLGSTVRLINLASQLCLSNSNEASAFKHGVPMLIVSDGDQQVALTVDKVNGSRDVVVKSSNLIASLRGIAGATIAGDGSVIPILDAGEFFNRSPVKMPNTAGLDQPVLERKKLAMVVDDSISVRRVNQRMLELAGWQVETAKDGVDALEQLIDLDAAPDLFLCDLEMPRMDGIELIRQIRDQAEFQFTPVVMVTSRASERHRHKAFDAGATEYVVKPYNESQLLDLIARLVRESREMV